MKSPLRAVKRWAASPRTSLAAIAAAAAAALTGFFFPRSGAYSSPWFLALSAAGAALLARSLALQVRAAAGGPRPEPGPAPEAAAIAEVLARRGYAPAATDAGGRVAYFEKNRAGLWGAAAFHAGLVLSIAAGFAVYAGSQRAFLTLMEGEVFDGRESGLSKLEKGPLAGEWHGGFGLRLDSFRAERWEDGAPRAYASMLTVLRGGRTEAPREASVNGPLSVAGVDVYQSNRYGPAVSLGLSRAGGRPTVANYLLDEPARPGRPSVGAADFPSAGYWVELKLDEAAAGGPSLALTVTGRGRELYRGVLRPGESARVDGARMTWLDTRRWSGLVLARQPAIGLAYAGFALCVLGGLLMSFLPHRRLRAEADGGGWRLAVASRAEAALTAEDAAWAQAELAVAAARKAAGEASDARLGRV